jgi:hypothetical protein
MSPRRDEEELVGADLRLVYIAGSVAEAEAAERLLTGGDVDYALRLDVYRTTSPLGGEYGGLYVYVPHADHARCRALLEAGGLPDVIGLGGREQEDYRGTGR